MALNAQEHCCVEGQEHRLVIFEFGAGAVALVLTSLSALHGVPGHTWPPSFMCMDAGCARSKPESRGGGGGGWPHAQSINAQWINIARQPVHNQAMHIGST
eukprot:1160727-Pelagomonas_calceolata.AAC.19